MQDSSFMDFHHSFGHALSKVGRGARSCDPSNLGIKESYFQKIESIVTILTSLDSRVNDEDVHYALEGLLDKYDQVCGFMHHKDTFPDLKTARSMLITEEMRLKSKSLALPLDSSSSSSPMVLMAESGTTRRSSTTNQVKSWRPCFNFAKGAYHTSPMPYAGPTVDFYYYGLRLRLKSKSHATYPCVGTPLLSLFSYGSYVPNTGTTRALLYYVMSSQVWYALLFNFVKVASLTPAPSHAHMRVAPALTA
ncbi:hypothetical protein Tco_1361122 [Tanacetum coccineum]